MAYNTFETVDNSLRGEPYGQMTPEGQKLWDEYNSLLNGQKGIPMRTLRLKSGATMQIPEPGEAWKNKMLTRTLGGMTGTGMGTRAPAQPGLFSQLAPLFIAAGIKDPKAIKDLLGLFSGGSGTESNLPSTFEGTNTGISDFDGYGFSNDNDFLSNFSSDDVDWTNGDWGILD